MLTDRRGGLRGGAITSTIACTASSMSSAARRWAADDDPSGPAPGRRPARSGATSPRSRRTSSISACARATGSVGSTAGSTSRASRANSRSPKVLDNASGARCTTADRCPGEAPSTRCAESDHGRAQLPGHEPRPRRSGPATTGPAAPGCPGACAAPSTARTPALEIWNRPAPRGRRADRRAGAGSAARRTATGRCSRCRRTAAGSRPGRPPPCGAAPPTAARTPPAGPGATGRRRLARPVARPRAAGATAGGHRRASRRRRPRRRAWPSRWPRPAGARADSSRRHRLPATDPGPAIPDALDHGQYAPRPPNTLAGVARMIRRSHSSDQDRTYTESRCCRSA